jgi:hypothetical protein
MGLKYIRTLLTDISYLERILVIQLGPKMYIELIVTMHACMSIIDEAEAGTGAGMATSSISWLDGPGPGG